MKTANIVCVAGKRSPMGKFGGSYKDLPVYDLAAQVIQKLLASLNFSAEKIDEVIVGSCRQAGNGPNPGRSAAVKGGIPLPVPVFTVNMACPAGMKSLELAAMRLMTGSAKYVLVGGMESMSTMPFLLKDCRWKGFGMGNRTLLDGWADSTDPLIQQGMGETAENLNEKYHISREEQDAFAATSHEKAHLAKTSGYFKQEIVEITVDKEMIKEDETIRFPVNMQKMAALPPVFRKGGTVTAGNACAMGDGAAFMLLTTRDIAKAEGYPILGELASFSQHAVEPAYMGEGPARVIPKVLEENKLKINDVDFLEVNEAFAVQVLANEKVLNWDRKKLNVHGGAIALSHPTGCSGVRLAVTLMHALATHQKETGIASLCGAGGVTMAMLLKRV